ncbi:hypothetical protein E2P81_ATG07622 [Venturia nashicola]|uniref:Uncharacterized protein n=1 Tax=Venturia nashicola TaxID=86259 RepID=A0A4Z1P733_9PEZI|nr:hypothetical protein E6O75_ATG07780 [Venturia nashicola]TLD32132.1 hypothetical protein E2P81_ATG07622 [Venturia nashicola]
MADQSPDRSNFGNRRQADTDDEQQKSSPASSPQHPPAPGVPHLEQRQFQPPGQTLPYKSPTSSYHVPVSATGTLLPAAPIFDRHDRDTSQLLNSQLQNQQLQNQQLQDQQLQNPQLPDQQSPRNFDRAREQTMALAHRRSQSDQHGAPPPAQRNCNQTQDNSNQPSQMEGRNDRPLSDTS